MFIFSSEGIRVIARDHLGNICGRRHCSISEGSVEGLKAKAILQGIRLAKDKEWQIIVVESDAEVVINHLKGMDFLWRIDMIMSNVLGLARSVNNVTWETIPITANLSLD